MDDTLRPRRRRGDSFDFSGPPEPRFWAKVARRGPDECWPWLAATDHRGYGSFLPKIEGERMAHRITYTLLVGPIPDGLTLDHLCRNKACQNPDHMEPVTREKNVRRDMLATGRAVPYPTCTHAPERRRYRKGKGSYCIDCLLERRRGGSGGGGEGHGEGDLHPTGPYVSERPEPFTNVTPIADTLVFTTSTGNAIHATNLLPKLRADLAAAGLPRVSIHDLRHSCATLLYAQGVPIETIADILGHSTPRITGELYRHKVPQLQREAMEAMQRALGS